MNSNNSFDNPYRPPEATDEVPAANAPLEFFGEITFADYTRMLPTPMDIIWGRIVLSLGVVMLLPLLAAAGLMVVKQMPGAGVAAAVGLILVTLAVVGAIYLVSPSARAYRYLRGNADLLGPARGMLDEKGLLFDDGNCTHWYSRSSLHAVVARTDGIRISLDSDPNRFLALNSRIFLSYNCKHAERIVTEFATKIPNADELQVACGEMFEKSQADEGFYSGTVSTSQSFKTAELWTSVTSELTTGIVLVLFAAFAVGYWRLVSILGIYCLIVSAQHYWQYRYGTQVTNHLAWGWIDSSGLIYAVNSRATWRPRHAFSKIVPHERYLEFQMTNSDRLLVYIEHMKNPVEFAELAHTWEMESRTDRVA